MTRVYPRPLTTGDTVAIVSPASTPRREAIERAVARLDELGLKTKTYGDLYRSFGYLAGTDAVRATELQTALADPEVAAVLPTRGGYGISRLVDRLDLGAIAKQPKIVAGFSDLTALHLALQAKTQLVTYHSPNLQDGLGAEAGLHELSLESYRHALFGAKQYEVASNDRLAALGLPAMTPIRAGRVTAEVVGGNMAVLCALTGTPFEVQTTDRILLLEDTGEAPYRIDRWLSQLRLAGKLSGLAGVLLGQFTDCRPIDDKPSLTLDQIWDQYFGELGVPVLAGFPCGHGRPNVTLPIGGVIELDADRCAVRVV
jgi:muramoyltetrapeptide carboxypeptidase